MQPIGEENDAAAVNIKLEEENMEEQEVSESGTGGETDKFQKKF